MLVKPVQTLLLISIDGMRPDAMVAADTPAMDGIRRRGSWTLQAQTVMPSVTLPCHTSMMRGVDTPRHGITTNTFHPLARPVPSLFDAAHAAGKLVGCYHNWGELRDLWEPGSVETAYFHRACRAPHDDDRLADALIDHVRRTPLDLIFLYLGYTDEAGHRNDWMSEAYLAAIVNADRCIARVLAELERSGRETAVLVLSDHGGHGRSHGTESPEDMTIPWLAAGPGIREGHEILSPVRIFDTCPTAAAMLGLPAAREWEGRIVEEIFA